jgi:anti-sigma factor ChrR (cupin superfamily)
MSAHKGSNNGHTGQGAPHDRDQGPGCRWSESLALEALGSLSLEESQQVAAHLSSGCAVCVEEQARVAETLAAMDALEQADQAVLPKPGAQVRAQLMRSIEAASARKPTPGLARPWQQLQRVEGSELGHGLTTVSDGPDGWLRTALAGIEIKPLFVDAAQRRVSMLVRMEPGTSYPKHRHAGSEECFVISGELEVGERTLRAGDYQVAARDSVHGVQRTEVGCVLFIVSSQDDELL